MDEQAGDPSVTLEFTVPHQHPSFPDHFPGDPLVPGALLLNWMIGLVAAHYRITGIKQCKFLRPVRPGDQLQWHVLDEGKSLKIRCDCEMQPVLLAQCMFCKPLAEIGSAAAHD